MSSSYELIDGIKCYAPSVALENDGFNREDFDELNRLEAKSFWFQVRNKIIKFFIRKNTSHDKQYDLLEIGCGTGFVLKGLSEYKNLTLTGSEIYLAGLKHAGARLPGTELIQLDATAIPFTEKYDVVGAFDVIEHIEADELVMKMVHKALRQNGLFLITVPQYQWMWSSHDDRAFHKRRYTRKELKDKLERNGFDVKYIGSFVFTLFPMMFVSRYLNKKNAPAGKSEHETPPLLNSLFYGMMYVDYLLIKAGLSLPFGGSLACVARKGSAVSR